MVKCVVRPCWRGNVDISPLIKLFGAEEDFDVFCHQNGYLQGILLSGIANFRPSIHSRQFTGLDSSISSRDYPKCNVASGSKSNPSMDVCRPDMEFVYHPQSNLILDKLHLLEQIRFFRNSFKIPPSSQVTPTRLPSSSPPPKQTSS